MKREFLELAHTFKRTKHSPAGWFMSEKLDGHRCFWDGGISRGFNKYEIPWANTAKDSRYIERQICTGLWSRYGNIIHAPNYWLDALPCIPMDGELYATNMSRQAISKIIKNQKVDKGWGEINYYIFNFVPYKTIFASGVLNNINFQKDFKYAYDWISSRLQSGIHIDYLPKTTSSFELTYSLMCKYLECNSVAKSHLHKQLPFNTLLASHKLEEYLKTVIETGGEGIMLRAPYSKYECCRSHNLLKVKPFNDAEGTVVGYITGRKTDKGSKLLGKMGSMILDYNGKRLELSGFTDKERLLTNWDCRLPNPLDITPALQSAEEWAKLNPETQCPKYIGALEFPPGTKVTFKYRGLSDDGVPQEARYWRKYNEI